MAITNTPNINANVSTTNIAPTNTPPAATNGVKAAGVGYYKQKFLWLTNPITRLAEKKHDKQLDNLGQQIRTECGARGLAILNQKLDDHHWTSSKKTFSGKELNTLRTEVHTTISENNQRAIEQNETILNQQTELQTQELFGQIFGGRDENDHSNALLDYPSIAEKLKEFKTFTRQNIKTSISEKMAVEKEKRILSKADDIESELKSDLNNANKYPELAQYIKSMAEKQFITESLNFSTAVSPYCTGAIAASPRQLKNLISIVEKFIDDRGNAQNDLDALGFGGIDLENPENNNSENANSFINISGATKKPILRAYDDLISLLILKARNALKTQAAEKLIKELTPAMIEINLLIVNDKLREKEGKAQVRAAAGRAVENEMLGEMGLA